MSFRPSFKKTSAARNNALWPEPVAMRPSVDIEQGTITIELAQEKHYGLVKIKDTGVGMAPEHLARIFDRFYRIEPARSETPGYGLGLAIAQAIVALHHGKIQVYSAVGQGTTFVLSLPRS